MIQNLFVIRNGIAIVQQNFGNCHSLNYEPNLVTSFISALQSFSQEITGSSIKNMEFEDYIFHFLRDPDFPEIFYCLVTDIEDDKNEISFKIKKIASIFKEKYGDTLKEFTHEISQYRNFGNILIDMHLAQKNCGGQPECVGCPNSDLNSRIVNAMFDL